MASGASGGQRQQNLGLASRRWRLDSTLGTVATMRPYYFPSLSLRDGDGSESNDVAGRPSTVRAYYETGYYH